MSKSKKNENEVEVMEVQRGVVQFCILGTTPLIMNRMAAKAMNELLLPRGKLTTADKANNLKHDPVSEYRNSVHQTPRGDSLLAVPSTAFKSAMANAAIDIPGTAAKAQIGRMSYVEGEYVNVFGAPKLHMAVVRMADMNRTPDIRTRAILPEWACRITVAFVKPTLTATTIARLLAGAGMMQGVGDFRVQKGKGNFGSFKLVDEDDADWQRIISEQGREVQRLGLDNPECYDVETAELLQTYHGELAKRELCKAEPTEKKAKKAKGNDQEEAA